MDGGAINEDVLRALLKPMLTRDEEYAIVFKHRICDLMARYTIMAKKVGPIVRKNAQSAFIMDPADRACYLAILDALDKYSE